MLELGLALIAACLPTLSFLFRRFNIQSLLRSLQSIISLRSLRSATWPSANTETQPDDVHLNTYNDVESNISKTSATVDATGFRLSNGSEAENYRRSDIVKPAELEDGVKRGSASG